MVHVIRLNNRTAEKWTKRRRIRTHVCIQEWCVFRIRRFDGVGHRILCWPPTRIASACSIHPSVSYTYAVRIIMSAFENDFVIRAQSRKSFRSVDWTTYNRHTNGPISTHFVKQRGWTGWKNDAWHWHTFCHLLRSAGFPVADFVNVDSDCVQVVRGNC